MNPLKMIALWRFSPAVFVAMAPLTASAAISIQNFTPATNDRFADDPAFVGTAYDWSGVGRSGGGQWVVMLSPTVFLSAKHAPASGTITFFPGNDPSETAVTRTVTTAEGIGTSDLWIGRLSSPLPGTIATYDFLSDAITEATFSSSVLNAANVFLSGNSPTATGYGAAKATNHAVGSNRADGFEDAFSVAGSTGDAVVTVQNLPGDAGFSLTAFEADPNSGDSGSPLMWISGGQLVVAGITWASGTADIGGGNIRDASIYTYTGSHAPAIQAYIDASPVPEPSAAATLLAALTLLSRRKR